jgi:hypothetical protein
MHPNTVLTVRLDEGRTEITGNIEWLTQQKAIPGEAIERAFKEYERDCQRAAGLLPPPGFVILSRGRFERLLKVAEKASRVIRDTQGVQDLQPGDLDPIP